MAATNINRVVLTGNLTRDPELRNTPSGTSVCSLRLAVQHPPPRCLGRVGRQAELLRRHGLGRAGRELRPVPREGPPRRGRRAPGMARVGGQGRQQAPVGGYHCRLCPVPGLPGRRRERWPFHAAERRPGRHGGLSVRAVGWWSRGRRHPLLGVPKEFSQVAKQRSGTRQQTRRRDGKRGPGTGGRRKPCAFCRDKVDVVDYKDFGTLRRCDEREGQDPLGSHHRILPAPSAPAGPGREARARARPPAVRLGAVEPSMAQAILLQARGDPGRAAARSSTSPPATCATTWCPGSWRSPPPRGDRRGSAAHGGGGPRAQGRRRAGRGERRAAQEDGAHDPAAGRRRRPAVRLRHRAGHRRRHPSGPRPEARPPQGPAGPADQDHRHAHGHGRGLRGRHGRHQDHRYAE